MATLQTAPTISTLSPTQDAFVYEFSEAVGLGAELLGGKGAGLAGMTAAGLPVPPGFVITTAAFKECRLLGGDLPAALRAEIEDHLARLERASGKTFGGPEQPLLVSVRSGAAASMPGMMQTVLNVGMNDEVLMALAETNGGPRFALDCYRRLAHMYAETVAGVGKGIFEQELRDLKAARGLASDAALSAEDMAALVRRYKAIYRESTGAHFPQDPREQLMAAVRAVFASWDAPRAQAYRQAYGIPDSLGTAVSVVQMVFGNRGVGSGTGVAFTRNPSTGEKLLWGEFLEDAQGEDVVSGTRKPKPLDTMQSTAPVAYEELKRAASLLELRQRDIQDIEFTVEDGRLFILQTRDGKRSASAAVTAAVDMANEGLISKEEAVRRIEPSRLNMLLHPTVDTEAECDVLAVGLGASPGAATGKVVLDAITAEDLGSRGEAVVLVRRETSPDDIRGLIHARGVLTAQGGMTSHAAVVARGMGKPCVAGCDSLSIDMQARQVSIGGRVFDEMDDITIDGSTGRVIAGRVKLTEARPDQSLETLLGWADEFRNLKVLANADTPADAKKARELGAEGVGLCRTEHMFMEVNRLQVMQDMVLAEMEVERRRLLDLLLPMQQSDFEGIFEAMDGFPVTVRLLDPPLHEFLPAEAEGQPPEMRRRIAELREVNPMLGMRGCRLGLSFPEIYEMQVRAIMRAARQVKGRRGTWPRVEVMYPLIGFAEEFRRLRDMTERVAVEEGAEEFSAGSMIELPRACVMAGKIAADADFLSFGTNDLTQTALGFSRDDAETKFLPSYLRQGILQSNPFETLDREGVGALMATAVGKARRARPGIKMGVCGEHGGDPASVVFFQEIGLDYVSCSPYRVPAARLAAAQAALAEWRMDWPGAK